MAVWQLYLLIFSISFYQNVKLKCCCYSILNSDYNLIVQYLIPSCKTAMTEITERTQKLLVLVGEEGPNLEIRDFKKVTDIIVHDYIATKKPQFEQFFLQLFPTVIRRVPLKQHIYAGLTAQIQQINQPFSSAIFKQVVHNLEKDLNNLNLHEAINGILYLSELMNLEKLNSQCFFDLIDDIVTYLENSKNNNHRAFFVLIFSRTLHNFCFSLNRKVYFQFKKLLERAKKYCQKNIEFATIFEAQQKGTINDGSISLRIYEKQPHLSTEDQIQQNIKLNINLTDQQKFTPIQYYFSSNESDKLYQEYQRNQGQLHLTNIEQIIELMKQNGQYVIQKLTTYINSQNDKNSFMQRFCVDLIIGKALKATYTLVETFILVKLIKTSRVYAELIQTALLNGLNKESENYDLGCEMKFAEIVSYVVNNWPTGGNEMTDLPVWDWEKFVQGTQDKIVTQEQSSKKENVKKTVLLKLICAKMSLFNDNFKVPACLKKYTLPEDLKNPTKYKAVQQMETFQNYQELLKRKADSQQTISHIITESDYEIFLEALFQRTSQSHTHLQVLFTRYQKVFQKFKQDFDWSLLNVIRSYWSKSLFHRLLYLEAVITRNYVDFSSYVKYISKVETLNEEEAHWVKLELNQLHTIFGTGLEL